MKATCPNNPDHKEFVTTAHVMQEWKVDENGEFIDVTDDSLEVSHWPSSYNLWTCNECYADAVVE